MKTPACVGPGLREGNSESDAPPDSVLAAPTSRPDDPRAAWLLRASARYHLVKNGAMTLAEAFSPDFVCDLLDATVACQCHTSITKNFDRIARELRRRRSRP